MNRWPAVKSVTDVSVAAIETGFAELQMRGNW
jgi:hypothetical protein